MSTRASKPRSAARTTVHSAARTTARTTPRAAPPPAPPPPAPLVDLDAGRRVALLAAIAEHGSITHAARAIGMSYKAAWDAVDAINNLAGTALVERQAGGRGGGRTRLTARGAALVAHHAQIRAAHAAFVAQLGHAAQDDLLLMQRMAMRTSARNQFLGSVSRLLTGAVYDEVTLALPGGRQLVATLTRVSTHTLGLVPGAAAYALVKASSVLLLAGTADGLRLSARNQLVGTVARVAHGPVHSDVVLDLGDGLSVSATLTRTSAAALGLAVGQPATALFKASSVIVATPG